jgi:hypothetical protein
MGSQQWVTLMAAAFGAAVTAWIALVNRREDELGRAARLTTVADTMTPGNGRDLVEQLRDEYAIDWALKHQAPRFRFLMLAVWYLYSFTVVLFVWWLVLVIADGFKLNGGHAVSAWFLYGAVYVVMLAATWCDARLRRKRRAWMEQERRWRGIPLPVAESAKTIDRAILKALRKR